MELTVKENNIINQLPATYQRMVSAKFKKPIKDYKDRDLEEEINNIVVIAYSELGIGADQKVTTFLCETLLKDFRQPKYATITIEEIRLFISNGIRGEYGSFNGQLNTINIQNIHHWVKSGLGSKERETALKEFNRLNSMNEEPKLSESEITTIAITGVKERFKTYKETGNLGYMAFASYNTLNDLLGTEINHPVKGRIKTLIADKNDRLRVYNEAKVEFMATQQKALGKAKLRKNQDLADQIEFIISDFQNNASFEVLLKEKYLKFYFDSITTLNL